MDRPGTFIGSSRQIPLLFLDLFDGIVIHTSNERGNRSALNELSFAGAWASYYSCLLENRIELAAVLIA